MFVPFMYPALWIYFCIYSYKKDKKIFTKRNITILITTLLIPFLLGFIYYIVPNIYSVIINSGIETNNIMKNSENLISGGMNAIGYIYINIYSNILLLLPIPVFMALKKAKENKYGLLNLAFCMIFIELLLICWVFGKASMYYLSKNYFALWFILFYLNYKGLIEIYKKHPKIVLEIVCCYIILITLNLVFVNNKIEPVGINQYENITSVTEVYGVNKTLLINRPVDFYDDELQIVKYFNDNINYEYRTELVSSPEQCFWFYTLTRYIDNKEKLYTGKWQNGLERKYLAVPTDIENADYIIYFKRTNRYKNLKNKLDNLGDVIFENSSGGIIKCYK